MSSLIDSLQEAAESPTATHASLLEQAAARIERLEMTMTLVWSEALEEAACLAEDQDVPGASQIAEAIRAVKDAG
jgi:hypothetical protein